MLTAYAGAVPTPVARAARPSEPASSGASRRPARVEMGMEKPSEEGGAASSRRGGMDEGPAAGVATGPRPSYLRTVKRRFCATDSVVSSPR
ncbi:hypothetical protein NOK12_08430 [Nocardioides sp. OK12]|nr:hypothetical protein NOK12_08430 [Nocardioides sp. OK12]